MSRFHSIFARREGKRVKERESERAYRDSNEALEFMTPRHISRVKREISATALAQFPLWLRPKFQITPQLVPRISCLRGESTRDSMDPASFPEEKVFLWDVPGAG